LGVSNLNRSVGVCRPAVLVRWASNDAFPRDVSGNALQPHQTQGKPPTAFARSLAGLIKKLPQTDLTY
jgi:hypothetical protein